MLVFIDRVGNPQPTSIESTEVINCSPDEITEKMSDVAALHCGVIQMLEKSKVDVKKLRAKRMKSSLREDPKLAQWKAEADADEDVEVVESMERIAELTGQREFLAELFEALKSRTVLLSSKVF